MMSELFNLIPPFIESVALSLLFFSGLWWTVKKGLTAKHPALLFLGSFILRIGIVLTGFYFAADGQWDHLLACIFGFILIRYLFTRFVGSPSESQILSAKETEDAP